ncbi:MAG: DUF5591 domain-containing protein [Candidatus Hodarchaeales archaeon]
MVFEIRRMEGLARSGIINLPQSIETPYFIALRYNTNNKEQLILENQFLPKKSDTYQIFTQENKFPEVFSNPRNEEDSSLLINLYPSLQSQGKSLLKINSFNDLFPENVDFNDLNPNSFHLIPWDLPDIYLDKIDEYLNYINSLSQHISVEKTNFVLNIPFRNILKNLINIPFPKMVKILCLGDVSSLLNNPRLLVEYISILQQWVPPTVMLYAPGVPSIYFPVLTYMGIDLFDFSYLLTPEKINSTESQLILENHRLKADYINALQHVQSAIKKYKLRDLVRIYANSYPPLKSLLRRIDITLPCDQGTPLFGAKTLYCTDHTDFSRPEVFRFRKRVKENFQVKSHVQGILFLPCSAKKPYSYSKSHQFFSNIIRRTLKGKRNYVQEIILTSPLGVVPRDLEYTFPAAHYDIPVTGEWSKLEQDNLYQDIDDIVNKIDSSIRIIGFVKGVERDVLEKISQDRNRKIYLLNPEIETLVSKEGKDSLHQLLLENFRFSYSNKINRKLEFIQTIADYQFGKGVGELLFPPNSRIVGRKEIGFRIQYNKEHLSSFRPSSGFLTLSIAAAKRIQNHTRRKVIFEGKKIEGSTIFTNAIYSADLEIRINDEVIVENDQGQIIATGTSYLPGKLLMDMNRGYGVKIRKKVREK